MLERLAGNDALKRELGTALHSGRLPHAVLLVGEPGCGAGFAARCLAADYLYPAGGPHAEAVLKGEDTECLALRGEGASGQIPVKRVREAREAIQRSALSTDAAGRVLFIYGAQNLNGTQGSSANALLKIIEEPPLQTQFLLITHHSERVLQTISSRCQQIRVRPSGAVDSTASFASPELFSDLMEALLRKDLLSALDVGERVAALPSRETAKAFCKFASYQLRLIFLAQQGLDLLGAGSGDASRWASACPKTFPRTALAVFDWTSSLIDRNVNARLLFTDMVDRLFMLI